VGFQDKPEGGSLSTRLLPWPVLRIGQVFCGAPATD